MTRRFDRTPEGRKLHMLSLCAMAHYDFNQAGAWSYEQAIAVIRRLGLGKDAIEEQVRRAIFNVLARNQDDRVKNIAFLMDQQGRWQLSPAFDISSVWNPGGEWTGKHQMSLAGKRDHFLRDDLLGFAVTAGIKTGRANLLVETVGAAVKRWREFAQQAGVETPQIDQIAQAHRRL